MYNPHLLILTGENIKEDDLEAIQKGDLNYVPIHFMPFFKNIKRIVKIIIFKD